MPEFWTDTLSDTGANSDVAFLRLQFMGPAKIERRGAGGLTMDRGEG